jgi:hypothetical protein
VVVLRLAVHRDCFKNSNPCFGNGNTRGDICEEVAHILLVILILFDGFYSVVTTAIVCRFKYLNALKFEFR